MRLSANQNLQIASWYASNTNSIEKTVANTVALLEEMQ